MAAAIEDYSKYSQSNLSGIINHTEHIIKLNGNLPVIFWGAGRGCNLEKLSDLAGIYSGCLVIGNLQAQTDNFSLSGKLSEKSKFSSSDVLDYFKSQYESYGDVPVVFVEHDTPHKFEHLTDFIGLSNKQGYEHVLYFGGIGDNGGSFD